MIEVCPGLFVGSGEDRDPFIRGGNDRSILSAAKEPFHRDILGYKGPGAPREHPDYLFARRGNILALNLIDSYDPSYISPKIIDAALAFINERIEAKNKVLIHCNLGTSRAPSIAFIWMYKHGYLPKAFAESGRAFKSLYPPFLPKQGMFWHIKERVSSFNGKEVNGT